MATRLFQNKTSWNFELREAAKKLTGIGKFYLDNYKPVRVDDKTIKFVKQ